MLQIYLSYILKPKTSSQRRLFEKVNAYVKQVYGEEGEVKEGDKPAAEGEDKSDGKDKGANSE